MFCVIIVSGDGESQKTEDRKDPVLWPPDFYLKLLENVLYSVIDVTDLLSNISLLLSLQRD